MTLVLPSQALELTGYKTGLYTFRSPSRAAFLLATTFLVP